MYLCAWIYVSVFVCMGLFYVIATLYLTYRAGLRGVLPAVWSLCVHAIDFPQQEYVHLSAVKLDGLRRKLDKFNADVADPELTLSQGEVTVLFKGQKHIMHARSHRVCVFISLHACIGLRWCCFVVSAPSCAVFLEVLLRFAIMECQISLCRAFSCVRSPGACPGIFSGVRA